MQSVTIFAIVDTLEAAIHSACLKAGITFQKSPDGTFSIGSRTGSLRLTPLVHTERGDRFARIVLGFENWIRTIQQPPETARLALSAHLDKVVLIVGVVADPELDTNDEREELLHSLAAELHGLIFTGSAVVDATRGGAQA